MSGVDPEGALLQEWSLEEVVSKDDGNSRQCDREVANQSGNGSSLPTLLGRTRMPTRQMDKPQPVEKPSPSEEQMPVTKPFSVEHLPVFIHIYDVSQDSTVHAINTWLAHPSNPLKFGGIFHAGVEINGLEWYFESCDRKTIPGISCCEPRGHPEHRYRETVALKHSKLSAEDIGELLSQLIEEYPGDDYDTLHRNCCHFADDFCQRLGAGGIPGWIHRLARVGAGVDTMMYAVFGRGLLPDDDGASR
jgi:hypothetical protein